MPWDGVRRRAEENGGENPDVVLARIDENIKFLKAGAEMVRIQLHEHEKKDNAEFKAINDKQDRTSNVVVWASGGVCVAVFIINLIFRH